jgi:hypothetical protein
MINTAYLLFKRTIMGWKNTIWNRLFYYSNGLQTKRVQPHARCVSTSNAGRTLSFIEESEPGD